MGEQQNRCTMEENKGAGTSFRVYVALCLMGITGWLPMKVLWIQIPILERNSPEGDRLPLYFLLLMETCSVATVAYLLARRCCRPRLSEVPLIYSSLAMSVSCLVLLGAFWEHDTPIRGQPHSFVLLLATLLAALVSSVATVTYIPFAARLYPQYMTAMLLGEALSSLLPHILFLVQGAGRKPLCTITDSSPNYTMPVDQEGYAMQYNIRSSTVAPLLPIQLRYTVSVYFFIHAGVILLGALCFTTLRWHRRCLLEYRQPPIEQGEVELSGAEEEPWQCDGAYMLDDGSYSQTRLYHQHNATSNCDSQLADQLKDTPHPTSQSPRHNRVQIVTSEPAEGPSSSDCQYAKPHSFKVLLAILLWTATILAGPLSSIHSHACYPIGNNAFLMGALLTDAAAVMACLVTARCLTSGQSQVTIVIALTCLGSILLTYFVALITFSTETESHNSPLFGSAGELLAVSVKISELMNIPDSYILHYSL